MRLRSRDLIDSGVLHGDADDLLPDSVVVWKLSLVCLADHDPGNRWRTLQTRWNQGQYQPVMHGEDRGFGQEGP